jgi:hypothetical protein
MESERDARNFAVGRETEGMEAALRDVGEVFAETKEMLLEMAKELDIDQEELANVEPRVESEEAKKDPLYQRSYEFTMRTHKFLEKIEPVITPAGRESFGDIQWHHTVVSAKVFRAIRSNDNPDMRFDSINSAAVAIKSLTICIMAFEELALRYPGIAKECGEFEKRATNIKQAVRERFP